jgi:ligand-binding SRPBCC domain-containing protein
MSTHVITQIQVIPGSPERIWAFFCDPANLAIITPPYLDFQVKTGDAGSHIYEGQIIEYTVKPILGIPLYWMTEITHVREGEYFIDEQRFGPYQLWHHEHYFKEVPGGVEMKDRVYYRLPLWGLGDLAHAVFVRRQLDGIFRFRKEKTMALFGSPL